MLRRGSLRPWALAVGLAVAGMGPAACGGEDEPASQGAGGGGGEGGSLNVAIVDNPQMQDIAKLTPELFTKESNIKVNYTVLDEGTLRQVTTRDVAAGGRQFDVVMIGMFEAPQFGTNGSLVDLTERAKGDAEYDYDDLIPSVRDGLSADGKLYASPFYAESSFLMYREDVLKKEGVSMPEKPTWAEVAEIARKIDKPDMAGICLRGKPGWGDLGAALTTVVNTFGATWWTATPDGEIGEAQVDTPEFRKAVQFYVDLVKDAGEKDAANASFNECLSQYRDGKVAMWYDATVAAGLLEANDSPVKGKNGYAQAPVEETEASGWLWSWALAIPQTTENQDRAWEYISWATGPEYIKQAGERIDGGWAAIPPGTRQSTYEMPEYKKAAKAFAEPTLQAMEAAPIDNPGTSERPGLPGVQYVGVPEFQDVGNRCTEEFSAVIAGRTQLDAAIKNCQNIASQVVQ